MKTKFSMACIALALLFIQACNHASSDKAVADELAAPEQKTNSDGETGEQVPVQPNTGPTQTQTDTTTTQSATTGSISDPSADWDKKIIKTATVKYEVKAFDKFNAEIREKTKKYGAYIAQEENYQYHDRREMALMIKVPVAQFEAMLNDMQGKDAKQIERSIKAEDVTTQVIDTKTRLEAKRQMRLKYLEFLKQAKTMEDVLKVQAEINAIQEEIESAESRLQYLSNQSALSTIHLSFYEPYDNFRSADEDDSFWQKTGEAFGRGAALIKGMILVIISIWPLLTIAVAAWLLWKYRRSHK